MLDVHPSSLWRAVERGEIATVRFGRRRLVPVAALKEFIQAQTCEEPMVSTGSIAETVDHGDGNAER